MISDEIVSLLSLKFQSINRLTKLNLSFLKVSLQSSRNFPLFGWQFNRTIKMFLHCAHLEHRPREAARIPAKNSRPSQRADVESFLPARSSYFGKNRIPHLQFQSSRLHLFWSSIEKAISKLSTFPELFMLLSQQRCVTLKCNRLSLNMKVLSE